MILFKEDKGLYYVLEIDQEKVNISVFGNTIFSLNTCLLCNND